MRARYWVLILAAMVLACVLPGYAAGQDDADPLNETPRLTAPTPGESETLPPIETIPDDRSYRLGGCCQPAGSAWYFQADAMALRREVSSNQPFAALGQTTWTETENPDYVEPPAEGEPDTRTELERARYLWDGTASFTTVLALSDANMGRFQGGGRLLFGRTLGRDNAMEVSYFNLTDWRGTAIVHDDTRFVAAASRYGDGSDVPEPLMTLPGSLFSPLSGFGDWIDPMSFPSEIPFDGNNLAEIRYSSSLDNLEWNFRHWVVRVPGYFQASLLLGGRYMNVDETFYYHTEREAFVPYAGYTVGSATTSITTDTRNPMVGVQIGGTYEVAVTPGWWLDSELKFALFSNRAQQSTLFAHNGSDEYDTGDPRLGDATHTGIASAVDATFATRIAVTPHVAVHLGYQILYVSGLALASDNFSDDPDVLFSGPASVVANGDVLYHGAHVGLTCIW